MSVAIGIDLGTTNTVVAAVVDGVAVTLQDEKSRKLLPSVVSFQAQGGVLVGEPAREKRLSEPESTIFSVKPLFGRSFDSDETQAARARFPFKLVQGSKNSTMVEARGTAYALPEISAFVLRRAKAIAEAALRQPVDKAVITVPANFNDLQRASTKIAGKLAGLEVMRILNEPTAAALAYGQSIKAAEKIAVYDLGGGTFDITLLDLTNSVFEVLATAGDTALGGDDVDRMIADQIMKEVVAKLKVDPRGNPASVARIGFLAEEIKKELSTADRFEGELTGVAYKSNGRTPLGMPFKMTRAELEALVGPLLHRTVTVAQQSMQSVGLGPKDFERIILVGGATRMPLVARIVASIFAKEPSLRVNPDEVVALGAAIQAHALNRSKSSHKQVRQIVKAAAKPPPVPKAPTSSQKLAAYRPASSSKMPAVRPASKPGMNAVQPERTVVMAGAPPVPSRQPPPVPKKPPPVPRPAPKIIEEEHPAQTEMMTFSRGPATVSWDLPEDNPPPPPPRRPSPPPVPPPSRPSMSSGPGSGPGSGPLSRPSNPGSRSSKVDLEELDIPDLDMPSATTGIVAVPDDDLEFGLNLPGQSTMPAAHHGFDPAPGSGPGSGGARAPMASGSGASDFIDGPPLEAEYPRPSDDAFGEFDLEQAFSPEAFQQGSAIQTAEASPLLIDVTPLSLGVETVGGYADVLIPANSPVPCEKTRTFMTATDGQTSVTVRVAQGESPKFGANTRLGDVELSGLRGARRGEVKISVTFELDADGILNVRARDPDTGRETVATMRLVGATNDVADLSEMSERQARHAVQ